jgi:hypothetical protein
MPALESVVYVGRRSRQGSHLFSRQKRPAMWVPPDDAKVPVVQASCGRVVTPHDACSWGDVDAPGVFC